MRRIGIWATALVTVLLGWASPAAAHGGIVLTVHSDGRGSVWVTSHWEDGHPLTEQVRATFTATSPRGEQVGPAPLRQTGDPAGTLTFQGTLPVGEWRVVAETSSPAIARCQAELRVAGAASPPVPSELRCTPGGASPAGQPRPITTYVVITVAVFVIGSAVFVAAWARARRLRRR